MSAKQILIATGIFLLFACNNEDSVESINYEDSAFGVVGRWYTEKTDNTELDMFGEYTFTADGAVYVDEYRRRNGYKRDEGRGTYRIDGNRIVSNMVSNKGLPIQSGSELLNLNSLTFTTRNKDYGDMHFLRIVGIVTPHIGDTLRLDVQQAVDSYTSQNVKVISYSMTDDAIASIDEEGVLIPKFIGITYLKIETTIGKAALKISVSGGQNLWYDFSQGLGRNFNDIEKLFGKFHVFNIDRSDSIRYFYDDNRYVDSIDIYRRNNITDSIIVVYSKYVTKNQMISFMEQNLFAVDSLNGWYSNNDNIFLATFSARIHPDNHKLVFTRFDIEWDDRRSDYGLTYDELKRKYGLANNYQYGIATYRGIVKDDFISQISYDVSKKYVTSYTAVLRTDNFIGTQRLTKMIDDYIEKRYIKYTYLQSKGYTHGKNILVAGKEMILLVKRDKLKIEYQYIDN